jgi:hypothetical protein
MSHNSEVDIDYESLPIGAGQYLLFFLPLSVQVVCLVCGAGGGEDWDGCLRVWSWREAESGRTEVPHTSPSGGPWASYSGARPAILDLDLHLDLLQPETYIAIIIDPHNL